MTALEPNPEWSTAYALTAARDVDELWMDDLLDASRDPEPGFPEPVSITPAGREWLARAEQETTR